MKQVIVVVLDSIPFRCIGCYGNTWIETPVLDQLAHRGVAFDFCFSEQPHAGAWMQALCGRSELEPQAEDSPHSLLKFLVESSIRCAWIGDSTELQSFASELGFSIPFTAANASWELLLTQVAAWIRAHQSESFLLWLQLDFTGDWETPPEFHDLYVEDEEEPIGALPAEADEISPDQVQALMGTLAGRSAYFDHWLGRLQANTAETLDPGNLTWLVTADQGFPLGEHATIGLAELTLYEERVHLPLLVRDPAGRIAYRSPALVQPIDIYQTLLELFGHPSPAGPSSYSFLPTVRGEPARQREYACHTADDVLYAIRTHNWKLVLPVVPGADDDPMLPELYVKPEDCWDTHDVAELHPTITDRLELQLRRHIDAAQRGTLAWIKPLLPTQLVAETS